MPGAWRGTKQERLSKTVVRRKRFISQLESRELRDNMRILGFNTYSEYLRSDLWREIRAKVLLRDGMKCAKCGCNVGKACVHHNSYDIATLRGETLIHLHCVCGKCHKLCHKRKTAAHPKITK